MAEEPRRRGRRGRPGRKPADHAVLRPCLGGCGNEFWSLDVRRNKLCVPCNARNAGLSLRESSGPSRLGSGDHGSPPLPAD